MHAQTDVRSSAKGQISVTRKLRLLLKGETLGIEAFRLGKEVGADAARV